MPKFGVPARMSEWVGGEVFAYTFAPAFPESVNDGVLAYSDTAKMHVQFDLYPNEHIGQNLVVAAPFFHILEVLDLELETSVFTEFTLRDGSQAWVTPLDGKMIQFMERFTHLAVLLLKAAKADASFEHAVS